MYEFSNDTTYQTLKQIQARLKERTPLSKPPPLTSPEPLNKYIPDSDTPSLSIIKDRLRLLGRKEEVKSRDYSEGKAIGRLNVEAYRGKSLGFQAEEINDCTMKKPTSLEAENMLQREEITYLRKINQIQRKEIQKLRAIISQKDSKSKDKMESNKRKQKTQDLSDKAIKNSFQDLKVALDRAISKGKQRSSMKTNQALTHNTSKKSKPKRSHHQISLQTEPSNNYLQKRHCRNQY